MPNTDLSEGHNKTATTATYQFEGLRDTDVISSATLTNITENMMGNGVIPITLNNYNNSDRNNPISGNCCVRPNGAMGATKEIYVDAGVVCIDGMYYNVGSGTVIDITAAANYLNAYHPGSTPGGVGGNVDPIPNGPAATSEAILLVYVDPRAPNNVGLTYGAYVDTSTGVFPLAPSGHLVRQVTVLAWLRIGTGATHPVIHQIEDKRVFIRPGPYPVTSLIDKDSATDHENPRNDMIAGLNAANLPITDMGLIYARDPTAITTPAGTAIPAPQGAGETSLFYQTDTSPLKSYQLTPVHKTSTVTFAYTGAVMTFTIGALASAGGLLYLPLTDTDNTTLNPAPLVQGYIWNSSNSNLPVIPLCIKDFDFTLFPVSFTSTILTANPRLGGNTYDRITLTYTHAGV